MEEEKVKDTNYIDLAEASEILNVSKVTIIKWINKVEEASNKHLNKLPDFPKWEKINGKLMMKSEEVDKLINFKNNLNYGDLSYDKKNNDMEGYVTMSQASDLIGRTKVTVSRWYKWYEMMSEEEKIEKEVPELPPYIESDRGWKYIKKVDIPLLEHFRDNLKRGTFTEYTRAL